MRAKPAGVDGDAAGAGGGESHGDDDQEQGNGGKSEPGSRAAEVGDHVDSPFKKALPSDLEEADGVGGL